jgi:putative DNA primase/helicase
MSAAPEPRLDRPAEPLQTFPPRPRTDFDEASIPDKLKARTQWTNWRPIWDAAKGRWDKPPCDGDGNLTAPQTNPSDRMTFAEAVANHHRRPDIGIGFAVTDDDPYLGIDLDHAADEEGNPLPWAERYIDASQSYTERTVSGQGFRVWIEGTLPPDAGHKKTGFGPDQAGTVELYCTKRFFTVCGDHLDGTPAEIGNRQEELEAIGGELGLLPTAKATAGNAGPEPEPGDLTDEEVIAKALGAANAAKFRSLHIEGDLTAYHGDWNRADMAECRLLAFWCGRKPEQIDRLFRTSALFRSTKWDSKRGTTTYGGYTIAKVLSGMGPNDCYRPSRPDRPPHRTDLGNARRLARRYGDRIRYCAPWRTWLAWDGRRWVRDQTGQVKRLAKQTVQAIASEADRVDDEDEQKAILKWAMISESKKALDAMVAVAESEPGIPVEPDQFDADPWLLNVANGTIDLRTGQLRPHRKEDLITKMCPAAYDPAATCPHWEKFEEEIFAGDKDVIAYMRRAVGYAFTGVDSVQEIIIAYGEGSNGKNAYFETIREILGDYGNVAEPDLLLANKFGRHPTGVADLHGKRFVTASETDDGKELAEALVKRLTGDRRIKARFMSKDFFEFDRTFKVFLATNNKPEIKGRDTAIWRRIRLVPFAIKFETEPDKPIAPPHILRANPDLPATLRAEAPGILALLVRGCLDWQRDGMKPPRAVVAATNAYRKEMDTVGDFLELRCTSWLHHPTLKDDARVKAGDLYRAYVAFAKDLGIAEDKVLSSRRLGTELERLGYYLGKSNSKCWRHGIQLKADDEEDESSTEDANTPF